MFLEGTMDSIIIIIIKTYPAYFLKHFSDSGSVHKMLFLVSTSHFLRELLNRISRTSYEREWK